MGKYRRKRSKSSNCSRGQSSGVVTRAKTKASAAASYTQLRSRRRLLKPNSSPYLPTNPNQLLLLYSPTVKNLSTQQQIRQESVTKDAVEVGEDSFGENTFEIQARTRSTRETTPCSFIRDPDAIKTPGSSTKSTRPTEAKHKVLNTTPKPIPSTSEMDEFFTGPEKQQQRLFIEKYNYDPVNDKPLLGRYEWMKLDSTKNG